MDNELVPVESGEEGIILPPGNVPTNLLGKLKANPVKTVTELAIGLGFADKKDLAKGVANVFLAAREHQLLGGLFQEAEHFQKEGKLGRDEELENKPNFMKTLVDVMRSIDGNPDDEQFEAIKTMYFLYLSADKHEKDEAMAYALLQKLLVLTSSELLALITAYKLAGEKKGANQGPMSADLWFREIADRIGHGLKAAIEADEVKLVELMLITERVHSDRSGVSSKDYRLTDLGIALCEYLEFGKSVFHYES